MLVLPEISLEPGDLLSTHGRWYIRLPQQMPGEPSTWAGHTAGASSEITVTEALLKVRTTPWVRWRQETEHYQHYRNRNWTDAQREAVGKALLAHEGELYGGLKLGAHFGDWLLSWGLAVGTLGLVRTQLRLARRPLSWMCLDHTPICSLLYSLAAYKGAGYRAWGPPRQQAPDDLDDYARTHPEEWVLISSQ